MKFKKITQLLCVILLSASCFLNCEDSTSRSSAETFLTSATIDYIANTSSDRILQMGVGAVVTLKAVNGKYVSANNDGDLLIANKSDAGSYEKFEIVDAGDGLYGLKNVGNSKYVCAESQGASHLVANRDRVGKWECFLFVIGDNNIIGIIANVNTQYVCAEDSGSSPLIANRNRMGSWEKFEVTMDIEIDDIAGETINIDYGKVITLKAVNNKYISAQDDGNKLMANKTSIGAYEKFIVVDGGNGTCGLKCLGNNKYICAESLGTKDLVANRDRIGSWERFTFVNATNGKIAIKAMVNNKYVWAGNDGNSHVIANQDTFGASASFEMAETTGDDPGDIDDDPVITVEGLDKAEGTKLRIASYNVMQDRVFTGSRRESFGRIVRAINADVWALQEVSYGDAAPISEGERWLTIMKDISGTDDWEYSWDAKGRYLLSRHPIKWDKELNHRVHATWIDVPASISATDLVVINMHLAPGDRESARRDQAAAAVDFANSVRNGNYSAGGQKIPSNVTIIACGDYNAGTGSRPYKIIHSLDTGFVNDSYNPSYTPLMTNPGPTHFGTVDVTKTHGSVTFSGGNWEVSGGTIDHMLFRSNTFAVQNSFILNTLIMENSLLSDYGLHRADVAIDPEKSYDYSDGTINCDHFPIILDFRLK